MEEKICTKCGESKPLIEFYFRNATQEYSYWCYQCAKNYDKEHYQNNKDRIKNSVKLYRINNITQVLQKNRDYYYNNKEKLSVYYKNYYSLNDDRLKEKGRQYHNENKEIINENRRSNREINPDKYRELEFVWRQNNPDKFKAKLRRANAKYNKQNKFRISRIISGSIRYAIKENKQGCCWETTVNYTLQELKQHLEKQFTKGMSWDNYCKTGWVIDHIIPISLWEFDEPTDREFKQCFALCNLQPLWYIDNNRKGNKI